MRFASLPLLLFVLGGSALAPFLAGCSGDPVPIDPPPDATSNPPSGDDDDGSVDAPPNTDGNDASGDAPSSADARNADSDAGPAPLLAGDALTLYGVTSDGYAIVAEWGLNPQIVAVPLAGGPPQIIQPKKGDVNDVQVFGTVVRLFSDVWPGYLAVWTRAHGLRTFAAPASPAPWAVSADGSHVVIQNVNGFQIVDLADGSVATPTGLEEQYVNPVVRFAPNGDLFVKQALPVDDGGIATDVSVARFKAGTWAKTDLAVGAFPGDWLGFGPEAIDPGWKWLWAPMDDGKASGQLVSLSTGASTLIDTKAGAGIFDPAGAHLLYCDGSPLENIALKVLTIGSTLAPSTLDPTAGCKSFIGVSPDGTRVLFGRDGDAAVASTSVPGTTRALPNLKAPAAGEWFTADSRYVLGADASDGSFTAYAASANDPMPVIAAPYQGGYVLSGARVLVQDKMTGDLLVVDVATGAKSVVVGKVSTFPPSWSPSADRTKVAYVAAGGLYVASLP
jgi:hypothetical protein